MNSTATIGEAVRIRVINRERYEQLLARTLSSKEVALKEQRFEDALTIRNAERQLRASLAVDSQISEWNRSARTVPLLEFLNLTTEAYASWVETGAFPQNYADKAGAPSNP